MKFRPTGCWGASRRARSRRSRSAVRLARRREAGAGRTLVTPPVRAGANSARASLQLAPAASMSELAGADAGAPGRRARRAGGQPLQGEAKVRRPRWTAREDELLRIHVASMGTTWLDLAALRAARGRSGRCGVVRRTERPPPKLGGGGGVAGRWRADWCCTRVRDRSGRTTGGRGMAGHGRQPWKGRRQRNGRRRRGSGSSWRRWVLARRGRCGSRC